jgi:hypothetical protein
MILTSVGALTCAQQPADDPHATPAPKRKGTFSQYGGG